MTNGLALIASMTEREFGTVFAKLAMQLRAMEVDVATIKSYYEVLADCPLESIQASARDFATETGRKWLPTTAEWHSAAQAASERAFRRNVEAAAPIDVTQILCSACYDTGWVLAVGAVPMECPGNQTCGRRGPHRAHTYTKVCFCRDTNANYQRWVHKGKGGE